MGDIEVTATEQNARDRAYTAIKTSELPIRGDGSAHSRMNEAEGLPAVRSLEGHR